MQKGFRMGLMASSDGHDGHPGNAQSPMTKHHHIFHHLGSGYIAVLADELTRANVFDAMYDRRCYATTGVPIVLWFDINGKVMGREIEPLAEGVKPLLNIVCRGTNGIDHLRIVKNSRVVNTTFCHGEHEYEMQFRDADYDPGEASYYYVRIVQVDGESAWSSPIWIG